MNKVSEQINERISIYENDLKRLCQHNSIKYARQIESTSTALLTLRWVRSLIEGDK